MRGELQRRGVYHFHGCGRLKADAGISQFAHDVVMSGDRSED
jgi:hypothetical protein